MDQPPIKTTDSPDLLHQFAAQLIAEKDFGAIDPEVIEQMTEDLSDRIEDRLNATLIEKLPPEKLDEFNALLDVADREAIQTYCREQIADFDEVIAKELLAFRSTYLNA